MNNIGLIPVENIKKHIKVRSDQWERVGSALYWLASGLSLQVDVARAMGLYYPSNAGTHLFNTLKREKLVEFQTVQVACRYGFSTIITLSDFGKHIASNVCGFEVVESDWEKLVNDHSGRLYTRHAVAILNFVYHARLRGYTATVLPDPGPSISVYQPDVLIERGTERYFVEIEVLGRGDGEKDRMKWYLQQHSQLRVAFCALTPARRKTFISILEKRFGRLVLATDLTTLRQKSKNMAEPGELWVAGL